jgi:hypothetical protein
MADCGQRDAPPEPEREPKADLAARASKLGFTRDIPRSLRRACDADRPADAGICPPRWVPRGITTAEYDDFGDLDDEAFGISAQSPDGVPYHQLGHWIFGSSRGSYARILKHAFASASKRSPTRIAGVPATTWFIPTEKYGGQSMHRGHAVVTWTQGGRFHWASFHDPRNAPRAMLLAEVLITASDE